MSKFEFSSSDESVAVVEIRDGKFTPTKEGIYRIGLLHTDRGLYMSDNILKISQNGTVKIEGEYQYHSNLSSDFKTYKYVLSISVIPSIIERILNMSNVVKI